jgi:hypothetical protein
VEERNAVTTNVSLSAGRAVTHGLSAVGTAIRDDTGG